MTEAEINSLMTTVDEASWKQVGLFTEASDHPALYDRHQTPARMLIQPFTSTNLPEVLATDSKKPARVWSVGGVITHSSGQKRRGPLSGDSPVEQMCTYPFSRLGQRAFKPWKANKVKRCFILGSDVGLEDTCSMALCTLVGRFSYCKLVQVPLEYWVETTWKPLLGYSPEIYFLARSWFGFKCRNPKDASLILESRWVVDGGSLMLKRWSITFDPSKEYFQLRHL
jgi:hypothetical protein